MTKNTSMEREVRTLFLLVVQPNQEEGIPMEARILDSHQARANWREVLDVAAAGTSDVVVVIPYEDYAALQEELDDLRAGRQAAAIYEQWKRDRSIARPYAEFRAGLVEKGVLHEEENPTSLENRGDSEC
jgi:PHD/YefM family antitoxin component YafN of YafNO toxin-antitoxin module